MTRVGQILDVSQVRWTRDRDGVSEADIRIEGSACSAQAELLSEIEPKRSEIVIYRGEDRVWEGPVWRVGWHADYVEINAHDVMAYVMATPLSVPWDNRFRADYDDDGNPIVIYTQPTEVTTRIGQILQYEMGVWEAVDPPANVIPFLRIHHSPNEARTSAYTMPFEMTAGEHMQSLGRTAGIDWTVVGRAIHVWDVSSNLGRTRTLTEADFFSEVVITAYGADMAASVYVVGRNGVYGHASAPSPYYGPWTMILTAYNEEGTNDPTQAELDSQAKRNINGRQPVPVEVRVPDNSGVRLSETLTIHDMVPGVQIPLLATLNSRQMSQLQKIDHVTVIENAKGEQIQITLTPATKPDVDEETEPS
ncbi:MAG TPA: hypothetical protein VNN23_11910 [Ornithinibacter sp.]|nr:hypothetical protein [Ornithinibacter sp.]